MKLDLLILAIAPVATIILWIYLKDKYDKEPIRVLSKFFILGILVSTLAIYAEEILIKTNIFILWYSWIQFRIHLRRIKLSFHICTNLCYRRIRIRLNKHRCNHKAAEFTFPFRQILKRRRQNPQQKIALITIHIIECITAFFSLVHRLQLSQKRL